MIGAGLPVTLKRTTTLVSLINDDKLNKLNENDLK